jgi:hypothetical protein
MGYKYKDVLDPHEYKELNNLNVGPASNGPLEGIDLGIRILICPVYPG